MKKKGAERENRGSLLKTRHKASGSLFPSTFYVYLHLCTKWVLRNTKEQANESASQWYCSMVK